MRVVLLVVVLSIVALFSLPGAIMGLFLVSAFAVLRAQGDHVENMKGLGGDHDLRRAGDDAGDAFRRSSGLVAWMRGGRS